MKQRWSQLIHGTSLRTRLLAWLLLPLLVLVPLTTAWVYDLSVRPALDSLDRALTGTAVALEHLLAQRDGEGTLDLSAQTVIALRADLLDEVRFAVADQRGQLLAGDAALLHQQHQHHSAVGAGQWVFFDAALDQRLMRVAVHGAACGKAQQVCTILVAESQRKRRDAEQAVLTAALTATLFLAASLAALALLAAQRGLRPLRHAAQEVASRSLQRLEPIDVASMPAEVSSFVVALNDLFARLQEAAALQRAFLADASHQLRTPLATLLSESAQLLTRPHPAELHTGLERLHVAAERGARLAQQLLTLARAEETIRQGIDTFQTLDLAQIAVQRADDWLRPSLAADQDLGFELQPALVRGDPLLLGELMANLVLNAIRYAGPGASITVRTRSPQEGQGHWAIFEVEDSGPGLSAQDRQRVWQRFRRGTDAQGSGTGLGLSIVLDITTAHRGLAELLPTSAGDHGLLVRVSLPCVSAENLSPICRK